MNKQPERWRSKATRLTYFVARAWARHIGKPEGAIRCYTSSR